MTEYECRVCGENISDKEKYNNNGVCDECLSSINIKSKYIYNGNNNIDNILEKKRGDRVVKI